MRKLAQLDTVRNRHVRKCYTQGLEFGPLPFQVIGSMGLISYTQRRFQ